ncbi:MAG: TauD/TfdA family dioxygenase [Thiogranum sp.]|nr:TauD/TfdA family dioxygenase [Thiogranum sp.]
MPLNVAGTPARDLFDPDGDARAYRVWRERKLAEYPRSTPELMVTVKDGRSLTAAEMDAMHLCLRRANMVIYRLENAAGEDKTLIRQLGSQFGLQRLDDNLCADEDGITSLRVVEQRQEGEYIPYTNRRLNWHTDGYYNAADRQVRGVILHCVQPAAEGGENALLDHEIAYIQLRDENPDFIRALMAADTMTVPANIRDGREIRPQHSGPVFSVDAGGKLHMRYSARARNIVWKDDSVTRAATEYLLNLFQQDSAYIFRHRLKPGEGVMSNNVLHCRTEFSDHPEGGPQRLLLRARYYDRISDPGAGA